MSLDARYEAIRTAAPRLVKNFLQRGERQLAAFVERHLADTGAGEGRAGSRIGAMSGRLSRSLIPGQPGHIGRLGNPTEGSLERGPFGVRFGIDRGVVPYAHVHEYGMRILATEKMIGFFWGQYARTGSDRWKWMALGARKRGFIKIDARPFFAPGTDEWLRTQAPKELSRLQDEFVRVWNGG